MTEKLKLLIRATALAGVAGLLLMLVSPLALAAKPNCQAYSTHRSCKDPLLLPYSVAVYDEDDSAGPLLSVWAWFLPGLKDGI